MTDFKAALKDMIETSIDEGTQAAFLLAKEYESLPDEDKDKLQEELQNLITGFDTVGRTILAKYEEDLSVDTAASQEEKEPVMPEDAIEAVVKKSTIEGKKNLLTMAQDYNLPDDEKAALLRIAGELGSRFDGLREEFLAKYVSGYEQ